MKLYSWQSPNGNIGDDLNLVIMPKIFGSGFFDEDERQILFGIGSVLAPDRAKIVHKAQTVVLFGSGARHGGSAWMYQSGNWDIAFVRGPRTANAVFDCQWISDPAVLTPSCFNPIPRIPGRIGFVPYFRTDPEIAQKIAEDLGLHLISPSLSPKIFCAELTSCEHIISEALHGAILADAYRIPWIGVLGGSIVNEGLTGPFKWSDWQASLGLKAPPITTFLKSEFATELATREKLYQAQIDGQIDAMGAAIVGNRWQLSDKDRLDRACNRIVDLATQYRRRYGPSLSYSPPANSRQIKLIGAPEPRTFLRRLIPLKRDWNAVEADNAALSVPAHIAPDNDYTALALETGLIDPHSGPARQIALFITHGDGQAASDILAPFNSYSGPDEFHICFVGSDDPRVTPSTRHVTVSQVLPDTDEISQRIADAAHIANLVVFQDTAVRFDVASVLRLGQLARGSDLFVCPFIAVPDDAPASSQFKELNWAARLDQDKAVALWSGWNGAVSARLMQLCYEPCFALSQPADARALVRRMMGLGAFVMPVPIPGFSPANLCDTGDAPENPAPRRFSICLTEQPQGVQNVTAILRQHPDGAVLTVPATSSAAIQLPAGALQDIVESEVIILGFSAAAAADHRPEASLADLDTDAGQIGWFTSGSKGAAQLLEVTGPVTASRIEELDIDPGSIVCTRRAFMRATNLRPLDGSLDGKTLLANLARVGGLCFLGLDGPQDTTEQSPNSKAAAARTVPKPLLISWPDYSVSNPYQRLLYEALTGKADVRVGPLEDAIALLKQAPGYRPVVFHLHWLNWLFVSLDNAQCARRAVTEFIANLRLFKDLGGKIIWTVHNEISHESLFFDEEVFLSNSVGQIADCIHMHDLGSCDEIKAFDLPRSKTRLLPHGHYGGAYPDVISHSDARAALGLDAQDHVLLFSGMIRGYKGIDVLIDGFRSALKDNPRLKLVLAGRVQNDPLEQIDPRLSDFERSRILLVGRFIDDPELQMFFGAADFAIYPYSKILTSGSVLLALSFGVPVAAPGVAMVRSVLSNDRLGLCLPSPPTAADIERAIQQFLDAKAAGALAIDAATRQAFLDRWSWQDLHTALLAELNLDRCAVPKPTVCDAGAAGSAKGWSEHSVPWLTRDTSLPRLPPDYGVKYPDAYFSTVAEEDHHRLFGQQNGRDTGDKRLVCLHWTGSFLEDLNDCLDRLANTRQCDGLLVFHSPDYETGTWLEAHAQKYAAGREFAFFATVEPFPSTLAQALRNRDATADQWLVTVIELASAEDPTLLTALPDRAHASSARCLDLGDEGCHGHILSLDLALLLDALPTCMPFETGSWKNLLAARARQIDPTVTIMGSTGRDPYFGLLPITGQLLEENGICRVITDRTPTAPDRSRPFRDQRERRAFFDAADALSDNAEADVRIENLNHCARTRFQIVEHWDSQRDLQTHFHHRCGSLDPVGTSGEIVLFSCVKNDELFLPRFLAHYRALGVSRFVFVDDRSDIPLHHSFPDPDITVVSPKSGRFMTSKVLWLGALIRHISPPGNWVLTADADEFLELPVGYSSLQKLAMAMDRQNQRYLPSLLVDLLPDPNREAGDLPLESDFIAALDHAAWNTADMSPQYSMDKTIRWGFGEYAELSWRIDARYHLFGTFDSLRKLPFYKNAENWHLNQGFHQLVNSDGVGIVKAEAWRAKFIGVLRHYKFSKFLRQASNRKSSFYTGIYFDDTANNLELITGHTPEEISRLMETLKIERFSPAFMQRSVTVR